MAQFDSRTSRRLLVVLLFAQSAFLNAWRLDIGNVGSPAAEMTPGADGPEGDWMNKASELARWIDVAEMRRDENRPSQTLIDEQKKRLPALLAKEALLKAREALLKATSYSALTAALSIARVTTGVSPSELKEASGRLQEYSASETEEIEKKMETVLAESEIEAECKKARQLGLPGSKIRAMKDKNHELQVGRIMSKLESATSAADIDELIVVARRFGVDESRLSPKWTEMQKIRAQEYLESGSQAHVEALWEYSKSTPAVAALLPAVLETFKMARDKIASATKKELQSAVHRLSWVKDVNFTLVPQAHKQVIMRLKRQFRQMQAALDE